MKGKATKMTIKNEPGFISRASELSVTTTEPKWIIDGMLEEGLYLLQGKAKTRKSLFCQQLCLEVSLGTKALEHFDVVTGAAIHVSGDDTEGYWLNRLEQMLKHYEVERQQTRNLYAMFNPSFGETHDICEWIEDMKRRIPGLRLVVMDPFYPNRIGFHYDAIHKTFTELRSLAKKEHISVVLVRLEGKAVNVNTMTNLDGVITITRNHNSSTGAIAIQSRTAELSYSLAFNPETLINRTHRPS